MSWIGISVGKICHHISLKMNYKSYNSFITYNKMFHSLYVFAYLLTVTIFIHWEGYVSFDEDLLYFIYNTSLIF